MDRISDVCEGRQSKDGMWSGATVKCQPRSRVLLLREAFRCVPSKKEKLGLK